MGGVCCSFHRARPTSPGRLASVVSSPPQATSSTSACSATSATATASAVRRPARARTCASHRGCLLRLRRRRRRRPRLPRRRRLRRLLRRAHRHHPHLVRPSLWLLQKLHVASQLPSCSDSLLGVCWLQPPHRLLHRRFHLLLLPRPLHPRRRHRHVRN
jgi:hypothetical protein